MTVRASPGRHLSCCGDIDAGALLHAVHRLVGRLYRKLTERYLAMEAAGLKFRAEGIAR